MNGVTHSECQHEGQDGRALSIAFYHLLTHAVPKYIFLVQMILYVRTYVQ
jgi:hypothetical protein